MVALPNVRYIAPFRPHPWQVAPWLDKSRVLLLTGSAGGGKSRLAGEKVHGFLKKYPNATGIILRKTRESISKSSMLLLDRTVIGNDPGVRKVPSEHLFYYDNGSILAFGGMADSKQAEQIRSVGQDGKVDIIWMEEGTQFQETDFNELLPRLRGTAAPWRQIIITTNPDAPLHWINKRLIMGGEASVYFSGAKDNPANPADYLATLESLTGVQYDRLVLGKWSQAEGVVYDNWTDANVTDAAEYNPDLPVLWGVDDGYAYGGGVGTAGYHPRVIIMAQQTAQGGVNIFAEYVATGELPETTIERVESLGYKLPTGAFIDSSAVELRARLWGKNISTMGATHEVVEGIKNMRRFICDGQGVRLLHVHPRCTNFINEILSYRYDENIKAINGELRPAKVNDHALDAARYLMWSMVYD
jgi:phage terminase large subunit